ncbi:helix-turn-helix transcriptional regulator [Streptomyces sp. NPDC127197]|uniref:helix-turn-helix transcriptional regulator n=1 Tax=Streptomyces sp. NPDC127197 TaxID=3345388 RepID=UPI003639DDF0
MSRNTMLRDFLRSRRAQVTPEEAGLPLGPGARRVPGLRREEVADLAGISVDYYVRFEQGRCPNVSDALLDSVTRILRLTPVERIYLYEIARTSATHAPRCADDQQISAGLRLLLENLSTPAFVLGRLLNLLAMNEPAHALFRGLGARGNYLRWLILDAPGKAPYTDWNVAAHEAIAMLRFDAARHPHDPAVAALVDELTAVSSEFRRIWATHEVELCRNGRRRYRHPLVGEIVLHSERLHIPNEPDQTLFTYSVVPGSPSDAGLRRLTRTTDPAIATSAIRTATSASRKTDSVASPPSSTRSASAAPRLVPAPPSASREARAVPLPASSAAATDTTDLDLPCPGR